MIATLRQPRPLFWLICLSIFVAAESSDHIALSILALRHDPSLLTGLVLALPLGFLNDTSIAVLLGAPFLVGLYLLAPVLRRIPGTIFAHVLFLLLLTIPVFDQIADVFFWEEFDSRFNSIAVNYLMFPREVIGNIRESFDTRILLLVPVISGILYWALRSRFRAAITSPSQPKEARNVLSLAVVAFLVSAVIVFTGPLGFGSNREIKDITANGMERFLRAALTNDQVYDGLYPAIDEQKAIALVRRETAQNNTTFLDADNVRSVRRHVALADTHPKMNVVLVLEESFGSTYVNATDNQGGEKTSPNFDRLAANGLLFSNIYATGNRTVNALEAIYTSFPPIPGISTARRPGSINMYSLPSLLKDHGYRTGFLYGGHKVFDNMGTFWSGIGFENVWDQSDIADPGFTTIWGVADEYLFAEGLKRIDELTAQTNTEQKPFFLSMLTVSNHRPYLYPQGRIDKNPDDKRRYNSAAYADWAFGHFIDQASSKPWFKDTIFVFIGDHGPRVFGASLVPVSSFRVPLLFYAPSHISAARNEVIGSSMDVAPTLLGLLGFSYDSPFFGVDLNRLAPDQGRMITQHNFAIAMGDGHNVSIIAPGQKTYGNTMKVGPFDLQPADVPNPELLQRVEAVTQTAHRMFYDGQYHRTP